MLNNIVDNLELCGQHNIVQCCFHQARTGCAFFAVYAKCEIAFESGHSGSALDSISEIDVTVFYST